MIAALFVEEGGVYYGLPDVDPWPESRDARLYAGPWPVVAHPPCARWSLLGSCRGYRDGKDGGCFEAALHAVRTFGGVLEHPAHTLAWRRYGLPRPAAEGWTTSLSDPGWTCQVDQRQYGLPFRKPTWLYVVGTELANLRWGRGVRGHVTANNAHNHSGGTRSSTPLDFRDVLLNLARSAHARGDSRAPNSEVVSRGAGC